MKAIAFDFDGVLVFSEKEKFHFIQKTFKQFNIEVPDDLFWTMIGYTTKEFFSKCFKNEDERVVNEVFEIYERDYKGKILDYIKPVSVTTDFIKSYSGNLKFGVVSGSSRIIIEKALRAFGLFEKIETIVSKDDVIRLKPDPEPYILASKRLKISPQEMYVIEDSIIGATSAVAAGASCFVLLNSINNREQFKDLKVSGFIENSIDINKLK